MPNAASIKKAAEKRALRDNARSANNEAAAAELLKTSQITEAQNAERQSLTPVEQAQLDEAARATPKPSAKTVAGRKKNAKEEARIAAEQQADADARVSAAVPEEKLDLSYYRANNIDPPLQVLNELARRADVAVRDDARDLARAVGQTAYVHALAPRGRHSRERKMHKAIGEAEAAARAADEAQK